MQQGFFVLGITALIVAAALGVLYFIGAEQAQAPEAPTYTIPPEELRNPEEIVVEGNRFTDTRQGYSGIISSEWEIEKPTLVTEPLTFISEKNGCRLNSGFLPTQQTPEELIEELKQDPIPFLKIKKFEILDVAVANRIAKKVILDSEEQGYSEAIYSRVEDKTFQMSIYVFGNNSDVCSAIFKSFAEAISF